MKRFAVVCLIAGPCLAFGTARAAVLPSVTSANLTAHFDASNINGDGGATDPGDGNDVNSWKELVGGTSLINNYPTDGKPTFIAAGSGGIGNQATVHFVSDGYGSDTVSGDGQADDLLFDNPASFDAQTIFVVATMNSGGGNYSAVVTNAFHGLNIRKGGSGTADYYSGNSGDFVQNLSTAPSGGTININGNRRLDIPGGYGAAHVLKAERNTPATFSGVRISDNVVADRRWNGDVAEILAYDAKLSGDDTLAVQRYMTDKYGIAFNTALDERITESKQIALRPLGLDSGNSSFGVNFHYGGPTAGSFNGIGFDNIDLTGTPSGSFALSPAGVTLTFNLTIGIGDNTARNQNASITGTDAATLNTVANEFFYIGNPASNNQPSASMTFDGLVPNGPLFVQVLGGDSGWVSTVDVLANGSQTVDWMGVAEDGSTTGTASLLGFYTMADSLGQLQLDFTVSSGSYAGIAGLIITQVPEPSSTVMLVLGVLGMFALLRRQRAARHLA